MLRTTLSGAAEGSLFFSESLLLFALTTGSALTTPALVLGTAPDAEAAAAAAAAALCLFFLFFFFAEADFSAATGVDSGAAGVGVAATTSSTGSAALAAAEDFFAFLLVEAEEEAAEDSLFGFGQRPRKRYCYAFRQGHLGVSWSRSVVRLVDTRHFRHTYFGLELLLGVVVLRLGHPDSLYRCAGHLILQVRVNDQ